MRCLSILVFLFCFNCNTSVCQISFEIGSGFDIISKNSFGSILANSQFISINYGLTENIGIGIGYRRNANNRIGSSNFYVESREFNLGVLVRESGKLTSNEVYFSSSYAVHKFNFKIGIGYVMSRVNTNVNLSSVRLTNLSIHNDQIVNNSYEKSNFIRAGLQINYKIQLLGNLSFLPYLEFLYDMRASTNDYTVESFESINLPFSSIDEINDFNSVNKQFQHEPKYVILGVGLRYDL